MMKQQTVIGIIWSVFLPSTLSSPCVSQGLNNLWLGGFEDFAPPPFGGSAIDFASGAPVVTLQSRDIDLYHTAANITDTDGNLLFFTNGVVVGMHNGDTMANGTGLNPSDYTDKWYPEGLLIYQANLIIPDPGVQDQYYLFHSTVDVIPGFTTQYLYLSKIDMSLNGGSGAVTTKNQLIYTSDLQPGRLTAVKHGNGRDWWVYAHELNSDVFLRWIVTPQDVSGPIAQSTGSFRPPDAGQSAFSANGSRLAYYSGDSTGLDLFNVDRCSGMLDYLGRASIPGLHYGVGVSFSPNGRFLYLSAQDELYQVDAEAIDLQASLQLVAVWDSTYSPQFPFATKFGASLLAPDGKIYISTMNSTDKLHVINHPDSLGLACDVVQNGVTLPTYWKNSLPNHPNYHLGPLAGSPCDTLGLSVAEHALRLNLSLYPNPNAGSFTLTYAPQPKAGMLEVYDLHGKCVHTAQVPPWSQLKRVELPAMPAGVYLCRLRFGASIATQRLVIE